MKQIIGSAGSGKGFVLARKVAEQVKEGKAVRLLTFEDRNLANKVYFFLNEMGVEPSEANLSIISTEGFTSGNVVRTIMEHTKGVDALFIDHPIIESNPTRPYWESVSSYLNLMRALAEYTQVELWMALQSNRDTLKSKVLCILVVDEEDTTNHEVITLDTITDWVGTYSKSEFSK
jgi:hypothetical protein